MKAADLRSSLRRFNWTGWGLVLVVIALWQILVKTKVLDYAYLPPPSQVWTAGVDLVRSRDLLVKLGHTVYVTLVASAVGLSIGGVLGVALGLSTYFRTFTLASFDVLRTVPVIALMPVGLLIWGQSSTTEIAMASYASIWAFMINTTGGVRSVHPRLNEVARIFRINRVGRLRKIVLPSAVPLMLVGARLSIITALVVTIVAEMLVNTHGLGWGIIASQQALQPAKLWAFALTCGLLGYVLNLVLVAAVRLALPGSNAEAASSK
jgi:sulfonate transport system permease protein